LVSLPDLPNCSQLNCDHNQLTIIPELPKGEILTCSFNRLTALPFLINCTTLVCGDNMLTSLPYLPKCSNLICSNNHLPFETWSEWKIIWNLKRTYLQVKYFRLWYWKMMKSKAELKKNVHLELLWSPETKFYQQRDEYQHFLQYSMQDSLRSSQSSQSSQSEK
jgi:Leucine-rich repeat (LRR) protein